MRAPVDVAVGALVRSVRRLRGLSQAEVAERVGLSQAAVSRMEAGRRPLSLSESVAVETELDLPPGSLARVAAGVAGRVGATEKASDEAST